MDNLDVSDAHYDKKIFDLERRYDEQYSKVEETEELIGENRIWKENHYGIYLVNQKVYSPECFGKMLF